jgi:AcrR family transcriptional regulator
MGNREALLEAALECISERGYARTTARDLVAASGTNLGAIGYHFGSKERLLNEALYAGFSAWLTEVAAPAPAASPQDDPWQALELSLQAFLDGLEPRRALCLAFIEALAQAQRSAELASQMAAGYERYRRAVAEHLGRTSPGLAEPDAQRLATMIVALGDGLLVQWLLDAENLPSAAELTASLRAAAK